LPVEKLESVFIKMLIVALRKLREEGW
jgi:hypothetical protein